MVVVEVSLSHANDSVPRQHAAAGVGARAEAAQSRFSSSNAPQNMVCLMEARSAARRASDVRASNATRESAADPAPPLAARAPPRRSAPPAPPATLSSSPPMSLSDALRACRCKEGRVRMSSQKEGRVRIGCKKGSGTEASTPQQ